MKTMKSRRSGGDRGGIRKRGPIRTDRDGDMDMDAPGGRGGKRGRGGAGRPTGAASGSGAGAGRPARPGGDRPLARDKTLDLIQKAITDTRGSQVNIRQGKSKGPSDLEPFSVRGWKKSKVSGHKDGGVENLIAFLERRMNAHIKSGPRAKITKVCPTSEGAIINHQSRHHPTRRSLCTQRMAKRRPTFLSSYWLLSSLK